ncbi:MAG TPA: hypothetical protein VGO83_05535, partial [Thermoleophilaceae bacterium]|nr:hypothetical protein [Thermoleophilaceae bacterium]
LSTDLDTEPGGGLSLALDGGGGPDLLRTRVQGKIFGRGGNDRISAMSGGSRDRSNRVFCGSGRDRVFVDRTFFADADDCERVAHRPR